ncbi:MAG TPA: hypothetical protein VHG71_10020 [Verrucomicrobiae bacterium]|nr:hypothetical protein [Verrucomicrobiae bacterium]
MKLIVTTLLIATTAFLAQARLMRTWSYQDLFDQADIVVIAKPTGTQDTGEQATLPNIAPDVHVIGLSTDFDISVVVKGDKTLKKLILHHYRLENPKELMMNGPNLASFNPKAYTRFLLFLHRESDGRYSPVSGQTDPTLFSVVKLDRIAE